jgi:hypothetical protein
VEFQVSDESRWATQKCPSGYSCLTADRKDLCTVERGINGQACFVICLEGQNCCTYRHPFGLGDYCMCRVRQEIFSKYEI